MNTVYIAGGAGGIGIACARLLLARGNRVIILDLPTQASRVRDSDLGPDLYFQGVDVTDAESIEDAVAATLGEGHIISAWINAAGLYNTMAPADVLEMDAASWNSSLRVNLDSAVFGSLVAAKRMVTQGHGSIVNIASGAGLRPRMPMEYSVAKAGVVHASRCMALSLASRGVRVNVVAPGPTNTPMITDLMADSSRARDIAQSIPLRRVGTSHEVAAVVEFLCGDSAAFVTGSVYSVDGGTTLL